MTTVVCRWLRRDLELPKHVVDIFEEHAIDRSMLLKLNEKDLIQMGITNFMHRRKILERRRRQPVVASREEPKTVSFHILRSILFVITFLVLHTLFNRYILRPNFQSTWNVGDGRRTKVHYQGGADRFGGGGEL